MGTTAAAAPEIWCRCLRSWRRAKSPGPMGAVAAMRATQRACGGPSRGVPMRRRARMDRWVGLSLKYYGAGLKAATEGLAEQASNTARGTPGNRFFVMTSACALKLYRAQDHGAPGAPAFRAPSLSQGRECDEDYGRSRRPRKKYGRRSVGYSSSCPAQRGRGTMRSMVEGASELWTRSAGRQNKEGKWIGSTGDVFCFLAAEAPSTALTRGPPPPLSGGGCSLS